MQLQQKSLAESENQIVISETQMYSECTKIFAGDVSPQTQVSQGILQWESVLSVLISEKIAVR